MGELVSSFLEEFGAIFSSELRFLSIALVMSGTIIDQDIPCSAIMSDA